jgi:TPR repeat protein
VNDHGVPPDHARPVAYLQKAANQGLVSVQYQYADCLMIGAVRAPDHARGAAFEIRCRSRIGGRSADAI